MSTDNSTTATQLDFGSEMEAACGQRECTAGRMCVGCQVKIISYKEDLLADQSPNKPDILPDKVRHKSSSMASFRTGIMKGNKSFKPQRVGLTLLTFSDYERGD